MTFRYFAYGSNMLPARLAARCASARVVGRARALGFALEFFKPSKDGSGKATLVERCGSYVEGVMFELDDTQRDDLDRYEGAGQGYLRVENFDVEMLPNGESISCTTYISTSADPMLKPYDWYLAVVIAGAVHHEFDERYVAMLRAIESMVDERVDRNSRIAALEAMLAHGISDFHILLSPVRSSRAPTSSE